MSLWAAYALMLAGIAGQFVARMATIEDHDKVPSPLEYLRAHPYRCLNMLFACSLLILIYRELGQLNAVTAILTGYICQDAADRVRQKADQRLGPP